MNSNTPNGDDDGNGIIFPQVHIPEGEHFPDGNLGSVLEEIMKNGIEITREHELTGMFLDTIISETLDDIIVGILPQPQIDPDLLQRALQGLLLDIRKELEQKVTISVVQGQEDIFTAQLEGASGELNIRDRIHKKIIEHLSDLLKFAREK